MKPLRVVALLVGLLALVSLWGCGDAGDLGEHSAEDAEDVDSTELGLANPMLDAEEAAFIKVINDYRVSKGLSKLQVSIALTRAAKAHSKDMASTGKLSHTSSDGTATFTRIKKYYNYNTFMAENVAAGYDTAAKVFAGWKASSGHNKNMLSLDMKVVGIARAKSSSGTFYWTTDFGGYKDAVLSAGFSSIASNAGFESDSFVNGVTFGNVKTLQKWHLFAASGGSSKRSTSAKEAGSYGLRSVDPDPGVASATQVVRAAAGVNYSVSARTRRVSGSTAQVVYLDFLDSSYKRIKVHTVSTGTSTAWSTKKVEATAPSGTRYVRVILYGPGAAGKKSTFDYDTIKLTAW